MLLFLICKETWVVDCIFFDCSQSVFFLDGKNNNTHAFRRIHGVYISYYFLASSM